MQTIIEQIKLSLGEIMPLDASIEIAEATALTRDLNMDSSLFIELLMTLEDHIEGLRFDPENLNKDDFETVGSLARYIQSICQSAA